MCVCRGVCVCGSTNHQDMEFFQWRPENGGGEGGGPRGAGGAEGFVDCAALIVTGSCLLASSNAEVGS